MTIYAHNEAAAWYNTEGSWWCYMVEIFIGQTWVAFGKWYNIVVYYKQ